jgi:hypothetical protein
METILPIEYQIPSLNLEVELLPNTTLLEECLVYLEQLDEHRQDATLDNEAYKCCIKFQYDHLVFPRVFSEGDLVLVYDQDKDPLGAGKFKPMWFGLFIIKNVLEKGTYELVEFEGNVLPRPINDIYLKRYYA